VEPTTEDVRGQLDRILASEGFAHADRMSGFLRYVVERTLAGESDQIKEYVIGVEVFGRDQQYDPRLDSIVRVEARRLRGKVDEYYANAGRHDPIVVRMRRGSYVPAFELRETAPEPTPLAAPSSATTAPAAVIDAAVPHRRGLRVAASLIAATAILVSLAAWRGGLWADRGGAPAGPSVAVMPFSQFSTDRADELLAARITDGVTTELARLRTVAVVSRTTAQQSGLAGRPVRDIAEQLNISFLLEGSTTRETDRVKVSVRLVDARIDRKFWVEEFTAPAADVPELQRRVASAVAAAIARAPQRQP
jgi:TolB-like protein